jgi:anti-anti-sigma regulatory factor
MLVLQLDLVPFADATALLAIKDLAASLQSQGIRLVLCGANARVAEKLARMGVSDRLGQGGIQPDLASALASLHPDDAAAEP